MTSLPWSFQSQSQSKSPSLCEYIVLAEFDIDTGSTVRFQFPHNIPNYASDWFAENMLPEGVHNRVSDYTYMFLNRESPIAGDNCNDHAGQRRKVADERIVSENDEEAKAGEVGESFLFGINLCRTKYDSSVRRGAIVKAIAIFSRFSYVEIFKKPLDLALEKYFVAPSVTVLEDLFKALNSVDTSLIPRPNMTELLLMRRGITFDPLGSHTELHCPSAWNYAVDIDTFPFRLPDQETSADAATNANSETIITLTIPIHRTIDEVGDISVSRLVTVFGEATMRIYNAILAGQRILFVGYSHAAMDVAQMVFSAAALVAPPLTGICRRVFPYGNLTDLSFLQCPGYIAGVTNPMFQENDSWWDLLCVLDLPNNTGTVKSAEEKRAEDAKSKPGHGSSSGPSAGAGSGATGASSATGSVSEDSGSYHLLDFKFVSALISSVQAKISEEIVRQKFYDYTSAVVTQAQALHVIHSWQQSVLADTPRATPVSPQSILPVRKGPGSQAQSTYLKKMLNSNFSRASAMLDSPDLHPFSATALPSHTGVSSGDASSSILGTSGKGVKLTPFTRATPSTIGDGQESPAVRPIVNPEDIKVTESHLHGGADDNEKGPSESSSEAGTPYSSASIPAPSASELFFLKANLFRLQHETGLGSGEVFIAFSDIDGFIVDEASAQACLVLLPESLGGVHPIASGLFSPNPHIKFLAVNILQKFELYDSTRPAVSALNSYLKFAFSRIRNKVADSSLAADMAAFGTDFVRQDSSSSDGAHYPKEAVLFAMAGLSMSWTNLAVSAAVGGIGVGATVPASSTRTRAASAAPAWSAGSAGSNGDHSSASEDPSSQPSIDMSDLIP